MDGIDDRDLGVHTDAVRKDRGIGNVKMGERMAFPPGINGAAPDSQHGLKKLLKSLCPKSQRLSLP